MPAHGLDLETISIRGIQPEPWKNWRLPYQLPASVARASGIIRRFDPGVVFGTGGYVVGAVGLAALLTRRPLFLQVPDAYPGKTIRALSGRARTVFAAFETTRGFLPRAHIEVSGTPLRRDFWNLVERPRPQLRRLLVFGGSQGARRLNRAVEEALKSLMQLPGLSIHHVSGATDHADLVAFRAAQPDDVQERYRVEAFDSDMVRRLQEADLVVGRAGGGVAEMTAAGVPMILVPGPFAGGHQRLNAAPLADAGAAVVVPDEEFSGVRLAAEVTRIATEPGRLASMAAASRAQGRPRAALAIARVLLEGAR